MFSLTPDVKEMEITLPVGKNAWLFATEMHLLRHLLHPISPMSVNMKSTLASVLVSSR